MACKGVMFTLLVIPERSGIVVSLFDDVKVKPFLIVLRAVLAALYHRKKTVLRLKGSPVKDFQKLNS